jgi:Ca-activated chloride channel family protein
MLGLTSFSLPAAADTEPFGGCLRVLNPQGQPVGPCPLEHTDVQVSITGFVARVDVRQQFHNPYPDKIETLYTFPLSQHAAVDDMTMTVGDRLIRGQIKPRDEARQVYETAKAAGHVASLLDQERPNIFTQAIANIEPGEKVEIHISYVEYLDWEEGVYRFAFPMVVGPRYVPGGTVGLEGRARPTDQVPDANRITPPVTPEGTRAGHDISLEVRLDAGQPIRSVESLQHGVAVEYPTPGKETAVIKLNSAKTIPNKDFVLTYSTATDQIADTVMAHTDERGKFLTLVLQPPKRVTAAQIRPKEIIFVIDKSGSMGGFPIETAKEAMRLCINHLGPKDTFNLLTFAGGIGYCFDNSVDNTAVNRQTALNYLASLQGGGGTEMMKAIDAALGGPQDPERVRMVCFMTDGYVGNDMAIIDAVRRNSGVTRVFSFGIGTSVNRYLLDGMAAAGRGEVEYVLSASQAGEAANRFYQRVSFPVLTDITLDWGGLPIEADNVYPKQIPDLFGVKPVVITARYTGSAEGAIRLGGRTVNGPFTREIQVKLPETQEEHDVLASLWARRKVEHLMNTNLKSVQEGRPDATLQSAVTDLGITYRLLTQFTSFVAVEQLRVTAGGQSRTIDVPVEMPEGVSYEGVFGEKAVRGRMLQGPASVMLQKSLPRLKSLGYAGAAPALAPPGTPTPARSDSASAVASEAEVIRRITPAQKVEVLDNIAADGPDRSDDEKDARTKLAVEFRELADKVDRDGKDGTHTVDGVKVVEWKVEVAIRLRDVSDETIMALEDLGVQIIARAKTVHLVIAEIDVRRLDALIKLERVVSVELPSFGR